MKPPASKPSEDIEKIRQDLDALRAEFQALRDKEFSPLRQQINALDSWFKGVSVAAAVLAIFGLNAYFRELPQKIEAAQAKIDKTVIEVEQKIEKTVTGVEQRIDNAANEALRAQIEALKTRLEKETDELARSNGEFLAAVDYAREGKLPLSVLRDMAVGRGQSEIAFGYYTDLLLQKTKIDMAYDYLSEIKKQYGFPGNFRSVQCLTNAGLIQWINALSLPHGQDRKNEICEAHTWLQKAEKNAMADQIAIMEIRRPLELLVLLNLSEGETEDAKIWAGKAQQMVQPGPILSRITREGWFEKLKEEYPKLEEELPKILSDSEPKTRLEAEAN